MLPANARGLLFVSADGFAVGPPDGPYYFVGWEDFESALAAYQAACESESEASDVDVQCPDVPSASARH